ncbi:zinc finger domain-containing protein [Streptomyces roseoverticillatus]|uniref:Recombinase family protein n=1 Tax=Streptomyces roseoverticillatus TaxID=66429 RepID=A0ABV3IZ44_9ACTN
MSTCAAPAGSPCRTGKGKVAIQYHTARFRLMPALAKALNVPTPAVRKSGSPWIELPRPWSSSDAPVGHVRMGYARASTTRQSFDTQVDSLTEAGVTRIFPERISTRATTRPELEKAVVLCREVRASGVAVTLVAHEHKRLGRGIDLAMLAEELKAGDVGWSSSPANSRAPTTPPASCSPCSPRCPAWNASTSATAPSKGTNPLALAARP